MAVVYFDQRLGAAHPKRWPKYTTNVKSFKNKTTLNIVNVSYSFTQFSTLAKIYTTTAREPSIHA